MNLSTRAAFGKREDQFTLNYWYHESSSSTVQLLL